jgi:hypothetical protein
MYISTPNFNIKYNLCVAVIVGIININYVYALPECKDAEA